MKSYDQYCAVARALDAVGDRWVLLIVRELLAFGPSRYSDLRRGLPGIASNLLAERLKTMEADGLVERREARAPIGAQVYELSPRGRELEDVLRALTHWGLPDMTSGPSATDAIQPQWSALAAGLALTARLPAGEQVVVGIHTGDASVRVTLDQTGYRIERGPAGDADVSLSGSAQLVGGVLSGLLTPAEAADLGLEIEGRKDLFADLLHPTRTHPGARP